MILVALVMSLSFHEFGHAWVAKRFGDNTAERAGRLTINPLAHIDPMGLLMVIFVGFGYAKPVPTDPRCFTSRYAVLLVAVAGPGMNLLLAVITINLYALGLKFGWSFFQQPDLYFFFSYLALINLLLMVFNLLPIGALDGHYILPYFLPHRLALLYRHYNYKYGNWLLLLFVLLAVLGLPVFETILEVSQMLLPLIVFIQP
jgi:Zn-dependent protease